MKPSYTPEYRKKQYSMRNLTPEVRQWLLAARFSRKELGEFLLRCKKLNVRPCTHLRNLALKDSAKGWKH